MFTLRQISSKGMQNNTVLGKNYKVLMREEHYDLFCEIYKKVFEQDHVSDLDPTASDISKDCYGFVYSDECHPLFKGESYFIMTENGKTFDNLTYR